MRLLAGCYLTSGARETNQQTQAEVKGLQRSAGPSAIHAAIRGPGPALLAWGQCRKRISLSIQERYDKNDLDGRGEGVKRA